jgi:hypothetical protein
MNHSVNIEQSLPMPSTEMLERSVCFVLTIHSLGTRRKVGKSQVKTVKGTESFTLGVQSIATDVDLELVNISTAFLQCDEYSAIKTLDSQFKKYIESRCSPAPFKAGMWLLGNGLAEEVEAHYKQFVIDRRGLVKKFVAVVPAIQAMDKERLKSLYNEENYPSTEEVEQAYRVSRQYAQFDTPASLKGVSVEFFQEQKNELRAQMSRTSDYYTQLFRQSAAELMDHLVGTLTPDPGGKKKIVREASLDKFKDFFSVFKARNIHGDKDLERIADRAKELMEGIDAPKLRTDEATRDYVRENFTQIRTELASMITDKPARMIDLE